MFKSKKNVFFQYFLVFLSTFAFVFTAIFLRKYGYIKNFKLVNNTVSGETKRVDTDIKIASEKFSEGILTVREKKLFMGEKELVSDPVVESAGILEDGRIYFWKMNKGKYDELFFQKGNFFEKIMVPTEEGDVGSAFSKAPIISPDANFVVFLSSREALDNYERKALYIYNLKNFNLKKVTNNDLMTVNHAFISRNSNLIGFSYSFLDNNENKKVSNLGVILEQTTVNLFSQLKLLNNKAFFAYDNKKVLLNTLSGFVIFNLENNAIFKEYENYELEMVKDKKIFLKEKVDEKNQICGKEKENYYFWEFDGQNLAENLAIESIGFTVEPIEFNLLNFEILGNFVDLTTCQENFGIFNFDSKNFNKILIKADQFIMIP